MRAAKYWFSTPAKRSGRAVLSTGLVAEATSAAVKVGMSMLLLRPSWPKKTSRNVLVYHSPSIGIPCGPIRL